MTTQWRTETNLPTYVRSFAGLEEGLACILERLRPAYKAQALHPGTCGGLCRHLHQHISDSIHHKKQLRMLKVMLLVAAAEWCLTPADAAKDAPCWTQAPLQQQCTLKFPMLVIKKHEENMCCNVHSLCSSHDGSCNAYSLWDAQFNKA